MPIREDVALSTGLRRRHDALPEPGLVVASLQGDAPFRALTGDAVGTGDDGDKLRGSHDRVGDLDSTDTAVLAAVTDCADVPRNTGPRSDGDVSVLTGGPAVVAPPDAEDESKEGDVEAEAGAGAGGGEGRARERIAALSPEWPRASAIRALVKGVTGTPA